jgi:hypothetical protein
MCQDSQRQKEQQQLQSAHGDGLNFDKLCDLGFNLGYKKPSLWKSTAATTLFAICVFLVTQKGVQDADF